MMNFRKGREIGMIERTGQKVIIFDRLFGHFLIDGDGITGTPIDLFFQAIVISSYCHKNRQCVRTNLFA